MPVRYRFAPLFALLLLLTGCEGEQKKTTGTTKAGLATTADPAAATEPVPPTPPLVETFDTEPVLSIFPRAGDFRPEEADENLPYWSTFIEHLTRISGIVQDPRSGNRAWSFRSINTIDSVGWFSPVAVQPNSAYTVSFRLKAELPENAAAGIGILEFDQFLWVGEQYPQSLFEQHNLGAQPGLRLTGSPDFEPRSFTFTTGPATRMVHLVLYREGAHNRNGVLFDDVAIRPAP